MTAEELNEELQHFDYPPFIPNEEREVIIMNISKNGLDLIKKFEGCRLTAYKDSVGVYTIGWGTTNADYSITKTHIVNGLTISQSTADSWLEKSVNQKYVPKVMKYDSTYRWNQNELDALVSFAYNIGSIDQLTANGTRSRSQISSKILAYDKAGGKTLAGLTKRRKAEKKLFDTPYTEIFEPAIKTGWIQDDKGWWYRYEDGTYPKSQWLNIDGKYYYFKADGYMASDEYIKSSDYATSEKLYYVNSNGIWDGNVYKWFKDKVGYWLAQVGARWYARNQWAKVDGKWYYFKDDGYMATGTLTIDGKIYSFRKDGSWVG